MAGALVSLQLANQLSLDTLIEITLYLQDVSKGYFLALAIILLSIITWILKQLVFLH